jgi:hypothetical protein
VSLFALQHPKKGVGNANQRKEEKQHDGERSCGSQPKDVNAPSGIPTMVGPHAGDKDAGSNKAKRNGKDADKSHN